MSLLLMGKNLVLAPCEGTWSKMSHEPKSLQVMDDWSIVIVCVPASAMLAPALKLKYPLKCALLSHPDSVNGSSSLISLQSVPVLFGGLIQLGQSQGGASVVKGLLDFSLWVRTGAF